MHNKSQKLIQMEKIINAIKEALSKLKKNDGILFNCLKEDGANYDQRKLHEVCINHKLANYLEEFLFKVLNPAWQPLFTDIEFNREGINLKILKYNGQEKLVRPDIIIHNRKSGEEKINILVVECKKYPTAQDCIETDIQKIHAFLNHKYNYNFGLQVLYSQDGVTGTFYYKDGNEIISREI